MGLPLVQRFRAKALLLTSKQACQQQRNS